MNRRELIPVFSGERKNFIDLEKLREVEDVLETKGVCPA